MRIRIHALTPPLALIGSALALGFGLACGDDADTTAGDSGGADGGDDGLVADGSTDASTDGALDGDAPSSSNRMVLDPSFGAVGKAVLSVADAAAPNLLVSARGLVVQSTGSIVIAFGDSSAAPSTTDMIRLTGTGAIDTSFASSGGAAVPTNVVFGQLVPSPNSDVLIVSGEPIGAPGSSEIARFLASGAADPSFGLNGHASGGAGGGIPVVQANGRVLSGLSGGSIVNRLDTSGNLDSTFGSPAGYATLQPFTRYSLRALAQQADGQIVVSGSVHDDAGSDVDCVVARLTENGTRDTSFGAPAGVGGETLIGNDCAAVRSVTITSDEHIIIRATKATSPFPLNLVRLTKTGAIDATYVATTSALDPHSNVVPLAGDRLAFLALAIDGTTFGAWRIAPNGGVDTTFAPSGVRMMDERWDRGAFVAMQPDGRMVVVGVLNKSLVVARYLP